MRMSGRAHLIASGLLSLLVMGAYGVAVSLSAVTNGSFTVTWTAPTDQVEEYDFRWKHFAAPGWIQLWTAPGAIGSLQVNFPALPNTPTTDRWMCVDARMVKPTVGHWLSETKDGPACNTVEVGEIPVPTPPAPVPPPPEIFTGLTNSNGLLSFTYKQADCPRGVQQSTGALINGARTITLKCRR